MTVIAAPNQPVHIVTGGTNGIKVNARGTSGVSVAVPTGLQGLPGEKGPPGPPGEWVSMTQQEYDALNPKDPDTLYVIVP